MQSMILWVAAVGVRRKLERVGGQVQVESRLGDQVRDLAAGSLVDDDILRRELKRLSSWTLVEAGA